MVIKCNFKQNISNIYDSVLFSLGLFDDVLIECVFLKVSHNTGTTAS